MNSSVLSNAVIFRSQSVRLIMAVASAFAAPAWAQSDESPIGATFTPYVFYSSTYESNLFRKAPNETAPLGRDDIVTHTGGGATIDVPISRQRLEASVKGERVSYRVYDELNSSAATADGKWSWAIGDGMNGSAGFGYRRSMSNFEEQDDVISDVQNERKAAAEFAINWLSPVIFLANTTIVQTDKSVRPYLDRRLDRASVEVRWRLSDDVRFGMRQVVSRNDYIHPLLEDRNLDGNPEFARNSDSNLVVSELTWSWETDTKSVFSGSIGRFHQNYGELRFKDVDGLDYDVQFWWPVTARISIEGVARRSLKVRDDLAGDSVQKLVRVRPFWELTERITLSGSWGHEQDTYPLTPSREDSTTRLSGSLAYEPLTGLTLTGTAGRDQRTSTIAANEFLANFYMFSANFEF